LKNGFFIIIVHTDMKNTNPDLFAYAWSPIATSLRNFMK
jgi:hypothetical protein